MSALESGHTVDLWTGEWDGEAYFTLTLTAVRRNGAGIWVDGVDPRGRQHTNLLIHPWAERHIEARWQRTRTHTPGPV